MVYDTEGHDTLTSSRRWLHAAKLDKAIRRTRRLLASPVASENVYLRKTWETRLARQEANLRGVCRR